MGSSCPHCSADSTEYDSEAGANFCQSCGLQISVEELCFQVERNVEGQQYGTFVSATGRVAGKLLAIPAFTSTLPHTDTCLRYLLYVCAGGRGRDGHYTPGGATKQAVPVSGHSSLCSKASHARSKGLNLICVS